MTIGVDLAKHVFELNIQGMDPPEFLFHGSASRFIDSIREPGLRPGSRNDVHLSHDNETAIKVGTRHGRPVVLVVQVQAMHQAGFSCSRSETVSG